MLCVLGLHEVPAGGSHGSNKTKIMPTSLKSAQFCDRARMDLSSLPQGTRVPTKHLYYRWAGDLEQRKCVLSMRFL